MVNIKDLIIAINACHHSMERFYDSSLAEETREKNIEMAKRFENNTQTDRDINLAESLIEMYGVKK